MTPAMTPAITVATIRIELVTGGRKLLRELERQYRELLDHAAALDLLAGNITDDTETAFVKEAHKFCLHVAHANHIDEIEMLLDDATYGQALQLSASLLAGFRNNITSLLSDELSIPKAAQKPSTDG